MLKGYRDDLTVNLIRNTVDMLILLLIKSCVDIFYLCTKKIKIILLPKLLSLCHMSKSTRDLLE